jgi:hypothetical protein
MKLDLKSWLTKHSSLLKEFNATNLYDFYALELTQDKINDPDAKELLIDRGNKLLDDIIDSIGFVLFNRYAGLFNVCAIDKRLPVKDMTDGFLAKPLPKIDQDFPPHLLNDIQPFRDMFDLIHIKFPNWSWRTIINNRPLLDKWNNLPKSQKKELITLARISLQNIRCLFPAASNSFSSSWNSIYDLYNSHADNPPITNPKLLIRAINSTTQLVHNNGSILMYLPPSLDRAIQSRDIATLPQLLSQASDDVKLLLRSATLQSGGLTQEKPPLEGELLLVGIRRQLNKFPKIISVDIEKESIARSDKGRDSLVVRYLITAQPPFNDNQPLIWTSHTYLKHFLNPNSPDRTISTNILWDTIKNDNINKTLKPEIQAQLQAYHSPSTTKTPEGRYNDYMDIADTILTDFQIQYKTIIETHNDQAEKDIQDL